MATGLGLGLVLVGGGGLLYHFLSGPEPTVSLSPSASARAIEMRCAVVAGAQPFIVGDEKPHADSGDAGAEGDEEDSVPYAASLGRAIAAGDGFAVGALEEQEGGTIASLVTIDGTGHGATLRLGRSRGDLDPPVVAASGDGFLVAALEPNAGGISMRLGRVTGSKVEWGSEFDRGKGEALDVDLTADGDHAVVVWDNLKDDASRIMMASFNPANPKATSTPRIVSPENTDAEAPRVVVRSGGFYLLYIARGSELGHADDDYPAEQLKVDAKMAAGEPKKGSGDTKDAEVDESRGERMFSSWIEAIPLDEGGAPAGAAMRLSKETARVTGYDVSNSKDGFNVVWRDEDAPSGTAGGAVQIVHVTASGPGKVETLTDEWSDEEPGGVHPVPAGVPTLFDGWITVPEETGHAMLGRVDDDGHALEAISVEPSLGGADPVAARATRVLVAEPAGRAVRLELRECGTRAPTTDAPK